MLFYFKDAANPIKALREGRRGLVIFFNAANEPLQIVAVITLSFLMLFRQFLKPFQLVFVRSPFVVITNEGLQDERPVDRSGDHHKPNGGWGKSPIMKIVATITAMMTAIPA